MEDTPTVGRCFICLEDGKELRAGQLSFIAMEDSKVADWVKLCAGCTEKIERDYGPAPLSPEPSVAEDWDFFVAFNEAIPFANEDP